MTSDTPNPLLLIRKQRSHLLFILSKPKQARESDFLKWYQGAYRDAVVGIENVLSLQHYEQHPVDITRGRFAPLPFRYLGLCEISVDGAQAAQNLLEAIERLHAEHGAAAAPAIWIYYPASEKAGRAAAKRPSLLTLAFANPVEGKEAEFREWYATRHIRHALNIPALVSGQCFLRTQFQRPGALEAGFHTIALYEQEGTPESIIDSFNTIPASTFEFPSMDTVHFAESVYRPL